VWDNPKACVKQLKVSNVPPPPAPAIPPAPRGPRYRYFSNPPSTVSLRLGDLAGGLPGGVRAALFDAERVVELPCADILHGPVPKISLTRLAAMAPECFQTQNFSDAQITLPAARLAQAYQMVITSEIIEEPVVIEPEVPAFAPPDAMAPGQEISEPVLESLAMPVIPADPVPIPDPVISAAPPAPPEPVAEFPPVEALPLEKPKPIPPIEPPAAVEVPPVSSVLPPPPRASALPQSRRPFSILPIFRRKAPEPEIPAAAEPRARVEIPKPRTPLVPLVPKVPSLEPAEKLPEPAVEPPAPVAAVAVPDAPPAVVSVPAEPETLQIMEPHQTEAFLMETEHLPRTGAKAQSEIREQDALQAIFMTEEFLAVDRVVELCGGLPGIKSCVLSQASTVLASHNVPDSIDLVSLSAHAMEMLSGMRTASAKMGIGAVPAVTVHSEKGPITFFHHEDLCLLVLHKDRGFVPGVREKLQLVVEELTRANLPLPVSSARPALEKWK